MKPNSILSTMILSLCFVGSISCNSKSKRTSNDSEKSSSQNAKKDSDADSSLDLNDILGQVWYRCLPDGQTFYYHQMVIEESSSNRYTITSYDAYYDDKDCTEGEEEIEDYSGQATIEESDSGFEVCATDEEFEKWKETYEGEEEPVQCISYELNEDGELVIDQSVTLLRRK